MRHIKTHQSLDNVGVMKAVTKHSVEIYDGDSIPEAVVNAFLASSEPPLGATFISLPQDVLMGPVEAAPCRVAPCAHGVAGAEALQEVAAHQHCRLPVIFAGMFASRPDVTAALRDLVRGYPLPVVNTYQAAGVVSRDLFNCYAGSLGIFRNQPGDRLLKQADVVLTVGFDPAGMIPKCGTGPQRRVIDIAEQRPAIDRHFQPPWN